MGNINLLGLVTVESCLFRCSNAEVFVDMANSSVLSLSRQQCRGLRFVQELDGDVEHLLSNLLNSSVAIADQDPDLKGRVRFLLKEVWDFQRQRLWPGVNKHAVQGLLERRRAPWRRWALLLDT